MLKVLKPENTVLKVTGEQGREVDEDVFPETAKIKEVCFVIYTDDGHVFLYISVYEYFFFVLLQRCQIGTWYWQITLPP